MTVRSLLPLTLALGGCTAVNLPAGVAPLDPIAFFTGETHGIGRLDPIFGKKVTVRVDSRGIRQGNALTLTQRIAEGAKPLRTRSWVMRPAGPGRYTGTLTDAEGPVTIAVVGPRATVRYRTPSGLKIRQQLALQPDGRTIQNQLEAFKYGVRVAVLTETIRK